MESILSNYKNSSTFLFLLTIVCLACIPNALALTSFNRQEIKDPTDWFLVNNYDTTLLTSKGEKFDIPKAQNLEQCKKTDGNFPFPRITAISYLSDGNKLNATLWLSSPIKSPFVNGTLDSISSMKNLPWHNMGYTMSISVSSVYKSGTDYFVHLRWDSFSQKWIKEITEGSASTGEGRIIQQDEISNFEENKNYVTFSLDLKKIGSPDKYNLLWSSYDVFINNDKLCYLVDVSNWAQAPPPEFVTSTTPNPILVRQGDKTTVEIEAKSATNSKSNVIVSIPTITGLEMNLINNQAAIPPMGIGTMLLEITSLQNASTHSYTIPLYSTYTFPTEGTIAGSQSFGNISTNITDTSYFVVTVQPSLSPEQNFSTFWGAYGGITGVVSGAILSILGKIGFDKLKVRKKQKTSSLPNSQN